MLKKLLKYDLLNVYKVLVVFYILSLFFGILTKVFSVFNDSFIIKIIGGICSGVTISMIFNILINNLMRVWVRFKNNFYGDESYLTHTLPVSKKTLYLSKILTAVISLFTSILVIGVTLFIAYYSKDNILLLKSVLLPLMDVYDSTIIKVILAFLFIFFLEFGNLLVAGYTGIVLGHRMNNNKIFYSIIYGFGYYTLTQIFVILCMFIMGLFNDNIMNLFVSNNIISVATIKSIIYIAIVIYSAILLIGYFVNLKLFNRGVNVD